VAYTLTALGERGSEYLAEDFSEERYQERMEAWEEAITRYLSRVAPTRWRTPMRSKYRELPQYAERLLERSVEVDLISPKLLPSASLTQHTVFVARFQGEYWVYGVGH
jgi:hypothetical protein